MNKNTKTNEIVGLDALRKQLELSLMMQTPTNLHQFLYGMNSFGNYINQGKFMQMYNLNTQQLWDNSVSWKPEFTQNQNWFNYDIFRSTQQEAETSGQPDTKDWTPPIKVGESRLITDSLNSFTVTYGENDRKEGKKLNSAFKAMCNSNISSKMTKPKSFSLDSHTSVQVDSHSDMNLSKVTQSTELSSTDPGTAVIDEKTKSAETASSLVFNIRRYNKKTKKYVLLTRHRKLITKCSHTDEEYYAKGMCKKWYHNKGERSKYATKCGHTHKYHYARGLCKACYLYEYHKDRKTKM